MYCVALLQLALCAAVVVGQQRGTPTPPNSFPHAYPGIPSGPLSSNWQSCEFVSAHKDSWLKSADIISDYEVTDQLPNITFSLPRSFAGNIPVNRSGHPNDTLFFWGFERQGGNGSLTDTNSTDPWLIWLNGG